VPPRGAHAAELPRRLDRHGDLLDAPVRRVLLKFPKPLGAWREGAAVVLSLGADLVDVMARPGHELMHPRRAVARQLTDPGMLTDLGMGMPEGAQQRYPLQPRAQLGDDRQRLRDVVADLDPIE